MSCRRAVLFVSGLPCLCLGWCHPGDLFGRYVNTVARAEWRRAESSSTRLFPASGVAGANKPGHEIVSSLPLYCQLSGVVSTLKLDS